MFGYIYVNQQELKVRELEEYRGYYCGLCRELKKRYGRRGQMLLNYDMTFLVLLLTGLYEPEEEVSERRCLVHPISRHKDLVNEVTGYAADMTVLLAYQKARDDWEDEHRISKWFLSMALKRDYRKICEAYPRQSRVLEESIARLGKLQQEGNMDIDQAAGTTGAFLGEMFVWKEDLWSEQLRRFGFYLGKFVYLLDALDDMEEDEKKRNYNPLICRSQQWKDQFQENTKTMLVDLMTGCAGIFEMLPILHRAEIIRNILYSGVWCKYQLICEKKRKQSKNDKG